MNESYPKGPLDIARQLQRESIRLDALAQLHLEHNPNNLMNFATRVHQLDYLHPWMGQEVSMHGNANYKYGR